MKFYANFKYLTNNQINWSISCFYSGSCGI